MNVSGYPLVCSVVFHSHWGIVSISAPFAILFVRMAQCQNHNPPMGTGIKVGLKQFWCHAQWSIKAANGSFRSCSRVQRAFFARMAFFALCSLGNKFFDTCTLLRFCLLRFKFIVLKNKRASFTSTVIVSSIICCNWCPPWFIPSFPERLQPTDVSYSLCSFIFASDTGIKQYGLFNRLSFTFQHTLSLLYIFSDLMVCCCFFFFDCK